MLCTRYTGVAMAVQGCSCTPEGENTKQCCCLCGLNILRLLLNASCIKYNRIVAFADKRTKKNSRERAQFRGEAIRTLSATHVRRRWLKSSLEY